MSENLVQRQSALVETARGLAAVAAQDSRVMAGLAAASAIRGVVVTDDETAAALVDSVKLVTTAQRAAKERAGEVLSVIKAMKDAVDGVVKPTLDVLNAAVAEANDANLRYIRQRREEQERAEAAERQRLADAAAKAKQDAEGDTPPPLEAPAPPAPPKQQVRGSSGAMATTQARLTCELANVHEADPTWLVLANTTTPLDAFNRAVRLEEVTLPPKSGGKVRWRGCDFYYVERMVNR